MRQKRGVDEGCGVAERGRAGERRGCWTRSCVSRPTTTPRALIHSEQSHSHQTAPPPTPLLASSAVEVLETASRRLCALREECVPPNSSSCLRLRFVLFGLLTALLPSPVLLLWFSARKPPCSASPSPSACSPPSRPASASTSSERYWRRRRPT